MKEVIIKYFGDKIESHEIVEEVGELIRCKDCKKYFPKTEERDSYCPFVGRIGLEPEGYCAWAKRRR